MCKFPCPFCILSSEKACPSDKALDGRLKYLRINSWSDFLTLLSMQNSTSMSWDYDYLYGIPSLQLWREQRSNHCMCSRLGMLFTQNTEREREKKSLPSLRNLMNSHLQLSLTQQVNDFTTLRIRKLNLFSVILHW